MGNDHGFENVFSYAPIEIKCISCRAIYCDYEFTFNKIITIDNAK